MSMTATARTKGRTIMTTFTINDQNEIVAFATAEEAAATTATPFDSFTSPQEWGELAASWPKERLVAIWNSLAGVKAGEALPEPQGRRRSSVGAHPGPGPECGAESRTCDEAESGTQGQAWRTGRQGCAREGEDWPEGPDGQEPAPGQKGRETAGCGRTARRQ